MAFTEAQLQAQIDADAAGLLAEITLFSVGATTTDVAVQNMNNTKKKFGLTQILNTRTAAQALTDIKANLN